VSFRFKKKKTKKEEERKETLKKKISTSISTHPDLRAVLVAAPAAAGLARAHDHESLGGAEAVCFCFFASGLGVRVELYFHFFSIFLGGIEVGVERSSLFLSSSLDKGMKQKRALAFVLSRARRDVKKNQENKSRGGGRRTKRERSRSARSAR
jgi:hypothetical protein